MKQATALVCQCKEWDTLVFLTARRLFSSVLIPEVPWLETFLGV